MGRHDSMDKHSVQRRPYCVTHGQFFRTMAGAVLHKQGKVRRCRIVHREVRTR